MTATHLCVGLVRDEDGVHEHVLGQVSLSLQGSQERVVVASGEDGRCGDIVVLSAGLTSCSGHVGRDSKSKQVSDLCKAVTATASEKSNDSLHYLRLLGRPRPVRKFVIRRT